MLGHPAVQQVQHGQDPAVAAGALPERLVHVRDRAAARAVHEGVGEVVRVARNKIRGTRDERDEVAVRARGWLAQLERSSVWTPGGFPIGNDRHGKMVSWTPSGRSLAP